ncbi:putative inositol-1-monophosphatase [Oceaniovalibus guishaninsula JLT2003]|uniref:Putative inositol-1-monophosphatase n=1 Tax=Oceaniovalibus guishaninsula JLT2003 TaxID=1231392 RepID=K2H8K8_9RHOB|nr:inositol monophosphatase family protein [Oceaniovalibus guishaninsula]EKE43923.1 putative inositol-1-monophosphatase [Oceaniovalibus guishaninsula JLT2003]
MTRTDPALLTDLARTALAMADAARPAVLAHFRRRDLAASSKEADRFDPVTEGDRACERALRDALARLRPDDAVLGEEYGATPGTSGLTWILDPIDGTRAYLSGAPSWGVLIAVADDAGPILGLIDQPWTGERFFGGPDAAWLDSPHGRVPLATRRRTLDDATLFSTFPEIGTPSDRAAFDRVAAQVRLTRYGLDCYAYGLLAAGHIDLVVEAGLQSYDIAAPLAVVKAAGGVVTDWRGGPVWRGGNVVAAGCPELHRKVLDLLATAG